MLTYFALVSSYLAVSDVSQCINDGKLSPCGPGNQVRSMPLKVSFLSSPVFTTHFSLFLSSHSLSPPYPVKGMPTGPFWQEHAAVSRQGRVVRRKRPERPKLRPSARRVPSPLPKPRRLARRPHLRPRSLQRHDKVGAHARQHLERPTVRCVCNLHGFCNRREWHRGASVPRVRNFLFTFVWCPRTKHEPPTWNIWRCILI